MELDKVKELSEEEFSGEEVSTVGRDDVGGSHETYFVSFESGDEIVVKVSEGDLCHLPDIEKGFELDADILEFIGKKTSLPVPSVLLKDYSTNEFEFRYFIMEKMEGENLNNFLDYPKNENLYFEIGCKLGELHNSTDFESAGAIEKFEQESSLKVSEKEWKLLFKDLVWNFTSILEDTKFEDLIDPMREVVENNIHILDNRKDFRLLHCEMAPWNLLGNEEEITAVLDWERSIVGDPEYDLFLTERFLSIPSPTTGKLHEKEDEIIETVYKGYRTKRELDKGWKSRRTLYRIANLSYQMWLIDESEEELKERWKKLKQEAENIGVGQ